MSDEEKNLFHQWRIGDFWGKHNISSRLLVIALFLFLTAITVANLVFGILVDPVVFTTTLWVMLGVILAYAFGPGITSSISDVIKSLKNMRG